jgi:DNA-binding SARP family transcriptional activator
MPDPTRLTLRLLGEIEVLRGIEPLVLPTSRKARALLAYLAATERPTAVADSVHSYGISPMIRAAPCARA